MYRAYFAMNINETRGKFIQLMLLLVLQLVPCLSAIAPVEVKGRQFVDSITKAPVCYTMVQYLITFWNEALMGGVIVF